MALVTRLTILINFGREKHLGRKGSDRSPVSASRRPDEESVRSRSHQFQRSSRSNLGPIGWVGRLASWREAGRDQLAESVCAVADGVLGAGLEFPKGNVVAVRLKHGIVTKAKVAPGRPDQSAMNGPLK